MAQNFRFLLLVLSLKHPQKVMISRCNMQFGQIEAYGKKSTLFHFKSDHNILQQHYPDLD